jgi:scyllo-inositol 2-dehydrogenase (NADP+)
MAPHDPLRAAVIGYGLAGSLFHAPLITSTEGMSVATIVTNNPERRAQAARDYPDATIARSAAEIWQARDRHDVVVVASPNRSHLPLGLAAIDAGLPVVMDKPLAPSTSAGLRLIEASRAAGVPLTVFQSRRWDGDFLTVRKILDEELLGPVVRFESRFERYRLVPKPGAWRELPDPEEGGGLLLDLGSHLIDQALVLFGRPISVYAEVGTHRPGAVVDDDTFLALGFSAGFHAHLWMNVTARILGPRFRINGLRGSFVKSGLDPQEPALREGMRPGDPGWGEEPQESWGTMSSDVGGLHMNGAVETVPGRYEKFYALLREGLIGGGRVPVDPADSLLGLEVIEAARKSAEEGLVISLPGGKAVRE